MGDHDEPARPEDREPAWPVRASVTEYETGWYAGGYDLVEQPDGTTKRYYWAELPPAVVVVAIDADADPEAVVFVEQYRPVIRATCLELPAGIVEPDESFAAAGARELAEETGYEPGSVDLLESFWAATGVLRHRRGIVLATDLAPGEPARDTNEFLTVRRIPAGEALERARAAPANDATLEGLLLAREAGHL